MLKDMGNTDANRQLTVQDLGRDTWKKSAAKVVELLFEKSNVDLSAKFEELIIVPDGALWYLPFEALPVGKTDDRQAADIASSRALCADRRPGDSVSQDAKSRTPARPAWCWASSIRTTTRRWRTRRLSR